MAVPHSVSRDHSGDHTEHSWRRGPGVRVAAGMLLVLYSLLTVGVAAAVDPTVDEPKYFNAGRLILVDGWTDPTTRLQGPLPLYVSQVLAPDFPADRYEGSDVAESLFFRGRLALLVFGWLGALTLFAWSRRLFGDAGGLFSLALFALNPLVIAYSGLITVDIAFASCTFFCLFLTWRFAARPSLWRAAGIGASLGAAFATKYLAVFYGPFVVIAAAIAAFRAQRGRVGVRAGATTGMVVTLVALVALHACYGFRVRTASRDADAYGSELVAELVELPLVGHFMGLFPEPFMQGVDLQVEIGEVDHSVYLNGRFARGHPGYYAWALLWKTPELVLLLGIWVYLGCVPRWFFSQTPSALRSSVWVLLPPTLWLFVYLSFFTTLQIGVRYVLPLLPVSFLFCGALVRSAWWRRAPAMGFALAALPLAHQAYAVASHWPNLLAYYNHASGGQAQAYRHFSDSNSEWGQSERRGVAAMEASGHVLLTAFSGPRFGPVAIRLVDRVRRHPLAGARRRHWLDAFEPSETFAAAFWAFDVAPERWETRVLETGDVRIREQLAVAYLADDRIEDAERHLALLPTEAAAPLRALVRLRAAALAPAADDATLVHAARAWSDVGRNDRAEALLVRAAETGPEVHPTLLATVVMKQGRLDDAIALLERQDFERYPIAPLTLARYYHMARRYKKAVDLLDRTRHLHDGALAEPAFQLYQEILHEHEVYSRALQAMRE